MHLEKIVTYKSEDGLVSVEVRNTGFVNQGSFTLHITDGFNVQKIGRGKFGDGIPDIFTMTVDPMNLSKYLLIILGNYAPAFGHNQISVDYIFYQKGKVIQVETIRQQVSGLVTQYDFTFKNISA